MKLCFPVEHNAGLDSPVYGHFGSAPLFVLVDSETQEVRELANRDLHHQHGACSPLKALGGETVEAIVVGGIGAGALSGLRQAGLKVYQAQGATVADNLDLYNEASLLELTPGQVCGGHGHGHGCSH
ncbi:Predicted Fe-Mo cluster-binding protein, NifX family [Geoalkalibacter ferrihydriticus]|uniref:Diguanylate cyclase n=2 Tax=Geoalkalibacter ferrihydriticus TaxID=392333 RepID=A0A0C2HSZ3_9BACT|nr:NifB/NifX family molybdenum-iron cluster-binding protein [Geoalkalibacter ferrihydriticus]KIH75907.1 diguanylate cyclase [Geoalkalibacter ferrihydriticus DSM 17813]SDM54482.1 Predicted Fe-Mo cluster-binding protein, NifX family [Geoalkalibacter ferrihydriticus]